MNRIILSIMMLVTASIVFTSCGAPAGNNAAANNVNKLDKCREHCCGTCP